MTCSQLKIFILIHILLLHLNFYPSYAQFSDPNKVDFTVYYEALCPYCSYFIAHDLVGLFTTGLISIVNLRLVPWGNAALDSSGYFHCQHGSGECLLNTVEACAVSAYPNPNKHYFFIQCIESLAYQQREAEWQSCFSRVSLNSQPIIDCYNQGNGRRLEVQNAYETNRLNPPHAYVPWVVVNNQPLREDYRNFAAHICRAYRGTSIPSICGSSQYMINSFADETVDTPTQVCSAGYQQNLTSFLPTEIITQSNQLFALRPEKP